MLKLLNNGDVLFNGLSLKDGVLINCIVYMLYIVLYIYYYDKLVNYLGFFDFL